MLWIIAYFLFFIVLTIFSILAIQLIARNSLQKMGKGQKRCYYASTMGAVFLNLIYIFTITSYIVLVIHSILFDPGAVGYAVMFFIIPVIIVSATTGLFGMASIFLNIPSIYLKNYKRVTVGQVILGVISLIIAPLSTYFSIFLLKVTLSAISGMTELVTVLESTMIHPAKLIYIFYYLGPIFLILGGTLGYINHLKMEKLTNNLEGESNE